MRFSELEFKPAKEYLEDLVRLGSNVRLFLTESQPPNLSIPKEKDCIIKVVAFVDTSDLFSSTRISRNHGSDLTQPFNHIKVYITPKYPKHSVNYFHHRSNEKNAGDLGIEYFFADRFRCSVALNTGVSYTFFYKHSKLSEIEQEVFDKKAEEFNLSDLS